MSKANIRVTIKSRYFLNDRLVASSHPLSLAEKWRWVWLPRMRRWFR